MPTQCVPDRFQALQTVQPAPEKSIHPLLDVCQTRVSKKGTIDPSWIFQNNNPSFQDIVLEFLKRVSGCHFTFHLEPNCPLFDYFGQLLLKLQLIS